MKLNQLLAVTLAGCLLLAVGLSAPNAAAAVTLTTLNAFYGLSGAQPAASLRLGADGNFYGTTSSGGSNGYGTVFRATAAGDITTLASFDSTNTGATPFGALVQGSDGSFYGTTFSGGTSNLGTVFMLTPSGTLSALASFTQTNGANPLAGLTLGNDGAFYGTTRAGGAYGLGTIFMVSSNGALSALFSFDGTVSGSYPIAGLTLGSSGALYGCASRGGAFNAGTLFRFTLPGSGASGTNSQPVGTNAPSGPGFTNLYSFTGTADGGAPQAALLLASDGNFYGTTAGGGTNQVPNGTVFKLTPAGVFTSLNSFFRTNGASPEAALVEGADGNLYGTARLGGAYGYGTAFSVTTAGVLTRLRSFSGGTDGSDPYYAGLTQGSDGNFYGVNAQRGRGNAGTFFCISGFAPYIMAISASQSVAAGSTVTLGVAAGGSPPLTYQWRRNSTALKDGETFSGSTTPSLTIANASTANSGTYFVQVKNSSGVVTNTGIVLTVLNPYGTNQPVLRISNPSSGAVLKNAQLTLNGTTACSVPVDQVYYQLNGGSWQLASPQGSWDHWNAKLVLPPGPNVIQAYALNIVGTPSPTNIVHFVCGVTSAPVVVQINGAGTVSPNYNSQWLDINRAWKMLAQPRPGYLFSNWVVVVASNAPVFKDAAVLSFNAQSNLVLQANFVPSPFIPLSGAYNGLCYDTNGVAPTNAGFAALNLTANGAFSGHLQVGATRYSLSGLLNLDGAAQVTATHSKSNTLQVALQLDLVGGSEQLSGTLSNHTWTAELAAARAPFNARTNPAPQAGRYTLVLPAEGSDAAQPGGDSYGTLTVDNAGRLRCAASLADGTKLTQAALLSRLGQWPLYASLYKGAGLLIGSCLVSNAPGASVSGEVTWQKPMLSDAKDYPGGFTVVTNLLGSCYTAPTGTANPLSFTSASALLSGAGLAEPVTNSLTLGANNHVTILSGPGLTLTFTPSTGLFRGKAALPTTTNSAAFGGVVLQDQSLGRGWFLTPPQSGAFLLQPASANP